MNGIIRAARRKQLTCAWRNLLEEFSSAIHDMTGMEKNFKVFVHQAYKSVYGALLVVKLAPVVADKQARDEERTKLHGALFSCFLWKLDPRCSGQQQQNNFAALLPANFEWLAICCPRLRL